MARTTVRGDDRSSPLPIITVGPSLASSHADGANDLRPHTAASPTDHPSDRGLTSSALLARPNSEAAENSPAAASPSMPASAEPAGSPSPLFLQIPGVRPRTASLDSASFHDGESSTLVISPRSLQRSLPSSRGTAVAHASSEHLPNLKGYRGMADSDDTIFPFSSDVLAEVVASKSLAELQALGGLDGLAHGLHTDCVAGLSADECLLQVAGRRPIFQRSLPMAQTGPSPAGSRSAVFGTNRLPERKSRSLLQLMWMAFDDKCLILLFVVATISLSVGLYQSLVQPHAPGQPRVEWVEGVTIITAVAVVVVASALNDWQKEQQFARLNNKKDHRMVKAIRSGKSVEISIEEIYVGDVLHVESGDVIPADGVLISCHNIRADESSMTGESDQIKKTAAGEVMKILQQEVGVHTLDPFLISGSKILEGIGTYMVIAVGPHSIYGKLRIGLSERREPTALQMKLNDVANSIARAGVAVAMFLFLTLTIQFLLRIPGSQDTPFDHLQTFVRIFIVSLAIIVLAVPEGLPLTVTLALAIAVSRMLGDNNLVRILSACETMGNATTVCCDKTGTLTMNKMTVTTGTVGLLHRFNDLPSRTDGDAASQHSENFESSSSVSSGRGVEERNIGKFGSVVSREVREVLVQSIAINSTAFEGEEEGEPTFIGSKTESALLSFAKDRLHMGPLSEERASAVIVEIYPFNSSRKSMASVIKMSNGTFRMYVKGAPELLLNKSVRILADASGPVKEVELTEGRRQFVLDTINSYTIHSLRTLGLAYRDFDRWPPLAAEGGLEENPLEEIINTLTFFAVFGIQDPLRPGVADAVAACQHAGVRVRMVTGDNITTAKAIATECGILTESNAVMDGSEFRKLTPSEMDKVVPRLQVLARSSPEDKATLVKKLKELGETVAATGDGTNDALALRAADVGFSMGLSGTEVAKEASDIVLLSDNFGSLVKAIEWGRSVNDVIKKFLQFQLTANITAVLLTFVSAVASAKEESILKPVQLLWVNLIMDTFAALALATDPPDPFVLDRQPDVRSAPLISVRGWKMIIGQSLYQLTVTLALNFGGNQLLGYTTPEEQASLGTLIFNTFVWMQLFNLYKYANAASLSVPWLTSSSNRRLDNKLNVFRGIFQNWYFIAINLVIIIGQVLIIFFGGTALSAVRLSGLQWAISLSLGAMSLLVAVVTRLIPDEVVHPLFLGKGSKRSSTDTPSRDRGPAQRNGIEQVRSELRDWKTLRHSFLEHLGRNVADTGHLVVAVAKKAVRATASDDDDADAERRPLLQHPSSSAGNGQSRGTGLLRPAAVMVGIVVGGIGRWLPSNGLEPR